MIFFVLIRKLFKPFIFIPQIAKEGLQESDGWGRLTSELEDLFERNDITNICEKLNALQKSLLAQSGLSGQQEREFQVDGFKNRLEALASPAVVQSFMSNDIGKIFLLFVLHPFIIVFVCSQNNAVNLCVYFQTWIDMHS